MPKIFFTIVSLITISVVTYYQFIKSPLTRGEVFQSAQWKAEVEKDGCSLFTKRLGMYHDLEKNYLKIGMNKIQMLELLGPPTFKYNSKIKNRPGRRFVYHLGKNDITSCYKLNVLLTPNDIISDFYLSN